jgi:hypothetical protein
MRVSVITPPIDDDSARLATAAPFIPLREAQLDPHLAQVVIPSASNGDAE